MAEFGHNGDRYQENLLLRANLPLIVGFTAIDLTKYVC